MGSFRAQLRQTVRRLVNNKTFTAITLLTLSVAIGANTAIFTVLEGVLLRPLAYPKPDELVGVWHTAPGIHVDELPLSRAQYFIYREQNTTLQDLGIYSEDAVSVSGLAEPEKVKALDVTDGILPLLGAVPIVGRNFTHDDMEPTGAKTAMLSYGYWQRRMNGDAAAVGRTLMVDGVARQIVGVLPKGFRVLDLDDRGVILPMQIDRSKIRLGGFGYYGIARLKPGVTLAQANGDMQRLLPVALHAFPMPPGASVDLLLNAGITATLRPLVRDVVGDVGQVLWILMASIGLVLLIACANVANLLLVRGEARQQELAIRVALGATRGRIAAELLFESMVLGLLGAVIGLALAWGSLQLLISMAPSGLPRLGEIHLDMGALVFTLAIAILASMLFGAVPIFKYAGPGAFMSLRDGGRTSSQSRERHRARNTLVVVQVGLAFVLLICSGLMIRTFRALTLVDPGFAAPADLQVFKVNILAQQVPDPEKVSRLQEDILARLAAIPGVTAAGFGDTVPMDGGKHQDPLYAEDQHYQEGQMPPLRRFKFVSAEYFQALGIPFAAGRPWTSGEMHNFQPVVVISENVARELWGDAASAVGKRVRLTPQDGWRSIVGIVRDVRENGLNLPAPGIIYWPTLAENFNSEGKIVENEVTYDVRSTRAGSEAFIREVRQAVWSVDPNLPLASVRTLEDITRVSMARTSFTLVMIGLAGGMALLLGIVGLYGVIAYSVSKRTREIGIRMALGAPERQLTFMFLRQGLWLTLGGVAAGLVVAFLAVRLMSSLLYGVSAVDPITYIVVIVGLVTTAAVASYLPSRRAASVDPSEALRSE